MTLNSALEHAQALDAADALAPLRDEFLIPVGPDGSPVAYFCGNSLGLQPRGARARVEQELDDWARFAVDGHFQAQTPWYRYHEVFRGPLSRLVGAQEREVVLMNSLTANLHLLMISFYRPTRNRYRILIEDPVFPSDLYAVQTQLRFHGYDPHDALIQVAPREGEYLIRTADIERALAEQGESIALVLLSGVGYYSGQLLDMPHLVHEAHDAGAIIGFDLAHAAGNVPLALHDWDVDFAAWCSYKYLNGGPGAMGGAFVHERHVGDRKLPRLGGWWGNDPDTRFRMHLEPEFVPVASADAWQLSNPSVFSMAPLRASMDLFDRVGMEALREKSVRLTGYLEALVAALTDGKVTSITPADPGSRGCQLSFQLASGAAHAQEFLAARGIVCDVRKPNVLRLAPVPLYNTFADAHRLATALQELTP